MVDAIIQEAPSDVNMWFLQERKGKCTEYVAYSIAPTAYRNDCSQ